MALTTGGVNRKFRGPPSLSPWIGGVGEIDGTLVGEAGVEELAVTPLQRGETVRVTLDAAMHGAMERAFSELEVGAAVVMDVSDGALRVLFSKGAVQERGEPVVRWHLATSHPQPPASTVKPFLAATALARGELKPDSVFDCKGQVEVEGQTLRCFGRHGRLDLARALIISDNSYFYQVALLMPHDDMARGHMAFGLGWPVGLPHRDASGLSPGRVWYEREDGGFDRAKSLSHAIGHAAMRVTPIQLARAYALLASGRVTAPHYLDHSQVLASYLPSETTPLEISERQTEVLPPIRDALRRAVSDADGTAHFDDLDVDAAGKTGTHGEGADQLGWFAGWSPAAAPRHVIVVLAHGQNGRDSARLALGWLRDAEL